MMLSADMLSQVTLAEFDVAIVGAGAVGVAIATRLSGRRLGRILLIEAGGPRFCQQDQDEYFRAQDVTDSRHPPTELYRRRMLGGTTSVWGGRCAPFDLYDFEPLLSRPGWPISYQKIAAYIPAALRFLQAGEDDFAAVPLSGPVGNIADPDLELNRVEKFSEPTNVWRRWGQQLVKSDDVVVLHGATCTNIVTTPNGNEVVGVELRTPANGTRQISARNVVLACGGLETPRLLLASRDYRSCGIGNEHDVVGRYFMTHISGISGLIRFATTAIDREFDYKVAADGTYVRRLILLSPEAMRRAAVANIVFRPDIHPIADPSHGDSILSAMFLAKQFIIPEYARRLVPYRDARMSSWEGHVLNVANGLPRLALFGCDWVRRRTLPSRKLPSVFLRRPDTTYPLSFVAEQLPISESRVLLGAQTDPYGIPRLIVQWSTCEADKDTVLRGYQVLASAARRSGLADISLSPQSRDAVEQVIGPAGGHHIGTVRMGSDSNSSVVDGNCEVWTTKRLFVAGCSVLPSSGYMSPTLTAVALGLRTADHILRSANTRKQVAIQTLSSR